MTTKLKSFDSDGLQFAWDATSVSSFEKCPRYYQLSHIQGWQPANKSEHLIFGGVYAAALERFHKLCAEGSDREDALHEVVRQALIETWEHEREPDYDDCQDEGCPHFGTPHGHKGARIPGTGEPWNSLHNTKTRGTLIRTIVWYIDHFADDPVKVLTLDNGQAACELSFSLEFSNDILWCGHLDSAVEYMNGQYVMDQKTTGSTISGYYFEQYNPDVQMGGYSWAGQQILGSPVKGVIIDAAQIAVGSSRFQRGFVHYSRQLLDEWYTMTALTIEDARRATAENNFRMNRSACGNYGGCAFRKVCSRIPEHRERVLRADFVQRPRWDPLERR